MSAYEALNLVAAFLISGPVASALTQVVKRSGWSRGRRRLAAVVLSIAVGVAQAWLANELPAGGAKVDAAAALAAVACVVAGANTFYRFYFGRRRRRARSAGGRAAKL